MKNLFVLIVFCAGFMFWCGAENFLASPGPAKRRSCNQIRQDIGQFLADILQKESKLIEKKAQLQQALCNRVGELIENDKKSFFAQASAQELQLCLQKLKSICETQEKEFAELDKSFKFISSGCQVN